MKKTVYLHIGNNYSVDVRDIVGIFDMDNTTVSGFTNRLLELYIVPSFSDISGPSLFT